MYLRATLGMEKVRKGDSKDRGSRASEDFVALQGLFPVW